MRFVGFQGWKERAPAKRLSDAGGRVALFARTNVWRIDAQSSRTQAEWHQQGVELERAGDLAGAIESYGRALRAGGPDAQIVFDLAYALAANGELDRAAERYRQVIELDPARQDAWVNLGDVLQSLGHHDDAVEAFREALALDPDDPDALYNLADALDIAGDVDIARSYWKAYLDLAPQFTDHANYVLAKSQALD